MPRLESNVLNYLDIANESGIGSGVIGQYTVDTYDIMNGDMVRQFHLQTPWTYNVSLGYTVGSSLALGAEYEYQDYSSMKFKDQEGYSDTFGVRKQYYFYDERGEHHSFGSRI